MSEAGYILDKTPNFELVSSYKGDEMPSTIQGDEWYLSYIGSPNNAIIDNSLYLDGYVVSTNNTLLSPYDNRELQVDDLLSFKFKMKFETTSLGSLSWHYAKFHTANKYLQTLSIFSNTKQVDELVFWVGSDYYIHAIDSTIWHDYNIMLVESVWYIYMDGVLVTSMDATTTTASSDTCYCEFIPATSATTPVNLYIKDVSMSFNTSYREGYNNAQSDLVTISSSDAKTLFPPSNLVNGIPNKPCVFSKDFNIEFNTDYSTDNVECDLAIPMKVLSILGHNITSQAMIIFSYGDSSSGTLTNITIPWTKEEIVYELTDEITFLYGRLTIVDLNNTQNVMIGEIIMGTPVYFSQCFFWNCSFKAEYNSIILKTDFKLPWNYKLNRIKSVKGIDFKMITDDTVVELYDLFEKANGSSYPILFFWDTRSDDLGIIYGLLMDKYERKLTFLDVNDVTKLEITGLPYAKAINDDV